MNEQLPSSPVHHPNGALDVIEIFSSIQGEGLFVGRQAVFVRLAHCNLKCPLCDTNYTVGVRTLSINAIVDAIAREARHVDLVVITGGEPFLQDIVPLIYTLKDFGVQIQVETNGTQSMHRVPSCAHIVCSPKSATLHPSASIAVSTFKYVVEADYVRMDNGLPTRVLGRNLSPHVAAPPKHFSRSRVYVQPLDPSGCGDLSSKFYKENLSAAIEICDRFGYTLGIQLHKLIGKE